MFQNPTDQLSRVRRAVRQFAWCADEDEKCQLYITQPEVLAMLKELGQNQQNFTADITETNFHFEIKNEKAKNTAGWNLSFLFFDLIVPEKSKIRISDKRISFTFYKKTPAIWKMFTR